MELVNETKGWPMSPFSEMDPDDRADILVDFVEDIWDTVAAIVKKEINATSGAILSLEEKNELYERIMGKLEKSSLGKLVYTIGFSYYTV